MATIRVAMAQLNLTVGDIDGNVAKLLDVLARCETERADVVLFPELSITGYPPEDLLLKPGFIADNVKALNKVVRATRSCTAIIGFNERSRGGALHNSACIARDGKRVGVYRKRHLPNTAVFDEERYFEPGRGGHRLWDIAGLRCGVSVCEDAWHAVDGPIARQGALGADLLLNINASPFYAGRWREREEVVRARALEAGAPVVYVNQVGGQDELVFEGGSMIMSATGELLHRLPQFTEEVVFVDLDVAGAGTVSPATIEPGPEFDDEVYDALVLGLRDYVRKNGFTDVVLGMSGGIDSSLVACIAADALGADHVHGVSMPSRYSSEHSKSDAQVLAEKLGVDFRTIPIEPAHAAFVAMLAPSLGERPPNLTEENLQARIRGTTWMALSNEFGWLAITAGNKSETSVGYSTLYGDTAGGFAVIKDVFKTEVWRLARHVNRIAGRELIPEAVITKPPSAELRPDQKDEDSLPPYELLDPILEAYVEQDRTRDELLEVFDPELVNRVVRLVDLAEHKRRQSPPGTRVSPKAFGKDRRMPITNGYRR